MGKQLDIHYIADSAVTKEFHADLLALLQLCFPHEKRFLTQRYNHETPSHRFYQYSDSMLISHVAVHDKTFRIGGVAYVVGGIAEVMVHPEYRGKGLVKTLLLEVDGFLQERGVLIAMLFGRASVYESSGYSQLSNPIHYFNPEVKSWRTEVLPSAMGKTYTGLEFPAGIIDLTGPTF